ncbi:MAG: type II toxin-antitoxin system VapC family toxin [Caulobacteraceae bacterium]
MRLYLDTSLLVAALTNEARAESVTEWMDENARAEFVSSLWVEAEFSAALSIKVRSRSLDAAARIGALAQFRRAWVETMTPLPIDDEHFRLATGFTDRSELGLRAGDALHLAIASGHGAKICTLDRRLAEAGSALGIETEQV